MTTTAEETAPKAAEVREWAEKRGLIEPGTRGRLPAHIWAEFANEGAAIADAHADAPPADDGEPVRVPVRELPATPARPPETPPERPKGKAAERAKKFWQRKDQPKSGRAKRAHKRVSLETLGGLAWVGGAKLVAFAGETYLPVVKMMSFQAPVAGAVVEDLAKDTIVDRFAQPIARLTESGGTVGALVGAPVLTALVCRRPELYPQVKPMLMASMKEWVIVAGPKLREMRKREEKFREEMSSFTDEYGFTIDDLFAEVFGDLAPNPAPETVAANGSPT